QGCPLVPALFDTRQPRLDKLFEPLRRYANTNIEVRFRSRSAAPSAAVDENVVSQIAGPSSFLFQTPAKPIGHPLKLLLRHSLGRSLLRDVPLVVITSLLRFIDRLHD